MNAPAFARQVTRPPFVPHFVPQRGTEYQPPTTNKLVTDNTPSKAVNSVYKTGICRNFNISGRCNYGDFCIFAHVPGKMRDSRMMNENTSGRRICKYSWEMCPYGKRCTFLHKKPEIYEEKNNYNLPREKSVIMIQEEDVDSKTKTRLCNNWMVNCCAYGSKCKYAHGNADLRRSVPALASKSGNTPIAPISLVKNMLQNEAQKPSVLKQKLPSIAPRVCLFKKKKIKKLVGIYADWIGDESLVPCLASEYQQ
ncbi:hypothetical protein SOVF_012320 [Spinacia oleracea]|uniref:Zinc finger CCCH domain-containing protein 39 n=1 Tax=Spinacia oleracea TaxID=3562 RepID=A0A9R0J0P1_SPIOL|nr:zinc finger CCCH domain-containing protein 39-like [Spinacia oleracea]XP_056698790.1 zinc finger CCCH domain-containing protein 39-like [Spinacia oleracea]XP_056698791.1 zinc finger CCCH domain-containing protein 39-like [Spinacia oleracea]XP_056698792.1 zinc finger CCCH domain-containing protein 39-like [Spinacia oleracea]KNA24823.1 hypothetical protein SOVF_012320 [Spinacia oleracea]